MLRTEPIGREAELEQLAALLARPVWVTLVGLPGVGKTELAHAAIAAAGGPHAVCLADDVRSEDVAAIRASAEGRAVLAVSRRPIGVIGEHVMRVAPLAVPARGASIDEIRACPAVRALLAAARRAGVPIDTSESTTERLAEIARRTSGLPLAIELVAASLPVVPLRTMRAMLARPGQLEAPPGPERPARHASVRAALAPVLDALGADSRALLVRIAPHQCGLALDPREVLAPLRALVDAGLVERAPGHDDPPRYRTPAIVGALALELASRHDADAARTAHAEDVAERARAAASAIWRAASPGAAVAIAELAADVEALLEHVEDERSGALAPFALAAALDVARAGGSVPAERLARLEPVAAQAPATRARVSWMLERSLAAERAGRAAEAWQHLEEASRIAAELERAARAEVALRRGLHLRDARRDYEGARAAFDVAAAAAADDDTLRIQVLLAAGGTGIWAERYADAVAAFEGAQRALATIDAPRLHAVISTNLAIAWIGHWPGPRTDPPRTRLLDGARRAVATFETISDQRAVGVAGQAEALTLTTLLRFDEARDALHAMRARMERTGDRRYLAVAHVNLGDVAIARGAWDEAFEHLARGAELARALEDRLLSSVAIASQGDLAWERGELGSARDAYARARQALEQDDQHGSRLSLVLAQQACLGADPTPGSLLRRAAELAGDASNVHRHCVAIYAALAMRRGGTPDLDAEVRDVLPWMSAWVSLARAAPQRRGDDGHGVPFATWLALRRFVRALDDDARRVWLERAYALEAAPGPTLLLDPDRCAVRAPDGVWTDLSRREKPFALLEVLAAPAWAPSRTFGVSTLVERVWDGEKVMPEAGANRVYVAMAALRKHRSLRDLILSEGDGYRLAPELEVHVFRDRA